MRLSNEQYDQIEAELQLQKAKAERDAEERKKAIFEKYPVLKELELKQIHLSLDATLASASGDFSKADALQKEKNLATADFQNALASFGLSEKDWAPKYHCPICKDTGKSDGKRCICFIRKKRELLYSFSRIKNVLQKENFSTLSVSCYPEELRADYEKLIRELKAFAENFPSQKKSYLFYGNTGVGKTFLTNCVAKAFLDRDFSVLYFSASSLFDELSKATFDRDDSIPDLKEDLVNADLVIIDDLGTELSSGFTNSELFRLLNERILQEKITFISTNLSPEELKKKYTERIASRILANFECVEMRGQDLRIHLKYNK